MCRERDTIESLWKTNHKITQTVILVSSKPEKVRWVLYSLPKRRIKFNLSQFQPFLYYNKVPDKGGGDWYILRVYRHQGLLFLPDPPRSVVTKSVRSRHPRCSSDLRSEGHLDPVGTPRGTSRVRVSNVGSVPYGNVECLFLWIRQDHRTGLSLFRT